MTRTAGSVRTVAPVAQFGIVAFAFVLIIAFNVALPKAGIAVGGLPVTFGYMLLGAVGFPALLGLLYVYPRGPALFQWAFGFLPLALLTIYYTVGNDAGPTTLIVYGTLLLVLPTLFLVAFAPYLERLSEQQIITALVWSIRFAVAWGIMNFVLYAVARQFFEIPYVTVNAGDVRDILAKNNRRGSLMKLVSTYNNGNVYGAVMIMLAPLYVLHEPAKKWRAAFLLAIVLTLSRTAWFGLIAVFLVMAALGQIRLTRPAVWILAGATVACIATLLPFMGWTQSVLIDSDLGGRMSQIDKLQVTPFGVGAIHVPEILYVGLLQSFGVIGCLFAVVAFGFPLLFGLPALSRLSVLRRSALAGCICYLLVAASDGAFIFAPVLPVFLLLSGLVYRRGHAPAAAAQHHIASAPPPPPPRANRVRGTEHAPSFVR